MKKIDLNKTEAAKENVRAELDNAEFDLYIDENVEESPALKEKADKDIDWEQRKWDLATAFILRHPDLNDAEAVELAENFIENYKQPFKTTQIV